MEAGVSPFGTSHYLGAAFVYFAIGRPAVVIAILIERASFMPQIPPSLSEIDKLGDHTGVKTGESMKARSVGVLSSSSNGLPVKKLGFSLVQNTHHNSHPCTR